jgi:hypothetical protein
MRNLQEDLKWLEKSKNARDLSDDYLREINHHTTRENYQNYAPDFSYGITFVESDIAYEWLQRALQYAKLLSRVSFAIKSSKADNGAVFLGDRLENEILELEVQK